MGKARLQARGWSWSCDAVPRLVERVERLKKARHLTRTNKIKDLPRKLEKPFVFTPEKHTQRVSIVPFPPRHSSVVCGGVWCRLTS